MNDLVLATLVASLLSLHGLRKKSLSPNGALTAFMVGLLTMAGGLRVFGVTLITFYLVGSRATKYGKQRKARLEEGYVEGGYRSGSQVLCNSCWAVLAVTVWNAMYVPGSIQARVTGGGLVGGGRAFDGAVWCAVESGGGWSRSLVFAFLGHFACCLGDTLASELGILSKEEPRLVTTLRKVPRGTNGGMSGFGTTCSVFGGAVIGGVMGVCIAVENGACGSGVVAELVALGAFAGGFGSLVDSVLGATVQQTRYSPERKLITETGGEAINGWNILTNNQVNLLSSFITAGLLAWMTSS